MKPIEPDMELYIPIHNVRNQSKHIMERPWVWDCPNSCQHTPLERLVTYIYPESRRFDVTLCNQ